mgnify:CR=1 FL=1
MGLHPLADVLIYECGVNDTPRNKREESRPMKYTFTTDAVSQNIQADDIDSAARQFGASNRIYAMETLKDLAGIIESNGG